MKHVRSIFYGLLLLAFSALFFVAPVSAQRGTDPTNAKISSSALQTIYLNWFKNPASYIFGSRKVIRIGRKSFGVYTQGTKGIMLYGGLAGAVSEYLGRKNGDFYSVRSIEMLSGLKVYRRKSKDRWIVPSQYNPAIVRWGYKNLIPKPSDRLGRHSYQQIYSKMFSRYFRFMVVSYLFLKEGDLFDSESKSYRRAFRRNRSGGLTYLNKRFRPLMLSYFEKQRKSRFGYAIHGHISHGVAAGFWLRRYKDGTAGVLWVGLKKLMRLYDRAWLRSAFQQQPYRKSLAKVVEKPRGKISKAMLLRSIYSNWFRKPASYIFGNKKVLRVGGKSFGVYTEGTTGIVFYGGLAGAISTHLGQKHKSFFSVQAIEALSGLKVYRKKSKDRWVVPSQFNPAIVRWGHKNLIPKPSDRLGIHTYQKIYSKIFSRYFRFMVVSYLFLREGALFTSEGQAYRAAISRNRSGGLTYLRKRFKPLMFSYFDKQRKSRFRYAVHGHIEHGVAAGFWLRRHQDGTSRELWIGLKKLMRLYDGAWLRSAFQRLPLRKKAKAKAVKASAYRVHKLSSYYLIENTSTKKIVFRFKHKNVAASDPSKVFVVAGNYAVLLSESTSDFSHLYVYSLKTKRKVFERVIASGFIPTRFNKATGKLKFWASVQFPASCPIKSPRDIGKKFKYCWGLVQLKNKAFSSVPRPNIMCQCPSLVPFVAAQFSIDLSRAVLQVKSTRKFRCSCSS